MILISNISEIYREYTRTQRYPGYIQGIFGLYLESNLNIPKEALGRFTVYSGYIAYIPRICPEDIGGNVRCMYILHQRRASHISFIDFISLSVSQPPSLRKEHKPRI